VARNQEASQHYLGSHGSSVEVSSVVVCTLQERSSALLSAVAISQGKDPQAVSQPWRITLKALGGKELAGLLTNSGLQNKGR
jgi:hypothetical protein